MDAKLYCKIMDQIWRHMGIRQIYFSLIQFYLKQSLEYIYIVFPMSGEKFNPTPNSTNLGCSDKTHLNSEVKYIEYCSCCASPFTLSLLHHNKLLRTVCIMLTNTFVCGNMHTLENILEFMFV